jgi:hypothetical protein
MTHKSQPQVLTITLVVATSILAAAGRATADDGAEAYRYADNTPAQYYEPKSPLPVELAFTQDHSSTAAEGFMRGQSAVIQAMGNYAMSVSQAYLVLEQTRSLNRENDLRQTQALLSQRAMWREGKAAERAFHDAQLEAGRVKLMNRRLTVHRAAYQLLPSELNMVTGEINWPVALQAKKYAAARARIEELVRRHVSYADSEASVVAEIVRGTDAMKRALQREINAVPRADYIAAQKFLRGLKLEMTSNGTA